MARKQRAFEWVEVLNRAGVVYAEAATPGGTLVLDIELITGTKLRLTAENIKDVELDIFERGATDKLHEEKERE